MICKQKKIENFEGSNLYFQKNKVQNKSKFYFRTFVGMFFCWDVLEIFKFSIFKVK